MLEKERCLKVGNLKIPTAFEQSSTFNLLLQCECHKTCVF